MANLTKKEKLICDIRTLLESVRLDWAELAEKALTKAERKEIRKHIDRCFKELRNLYERLGKN